MWSRRLTEPPRPVRRGERTPPPASRAPPLSGEAFGVVVPLLKRFHAQSASFTRRAFPPLSTGPSLKTERFQRGRSCGTGGNPVRGAPARLHRHKLFVRGGSGGRRAAWNPRRPPAAFGSFPLRERNSCVRRRTKLSQATPRTPSVCPPSTVAASNYKSIKSTAEERKLGSYAQVFPSSH